MEGAAGKYPQLVANLERYWTYPPPRTAADANARQATSGQSTCAPHIHRALHERVFDAAQYIDGTDPHYTFIDYKAGEARDFPVLLHGNVATPGDRSCRGIFYRFSPTAIQRSRTAPAVWNLPTNLHRCRAAHRARDRQPRLGLALRTALVATPSDFGVQGEKPTDPNCWTIWPPDSSRTAGRSNG